eukprot:3382337-Prymnesium_polylepis.2
MTPYSAASGALGRSTIGSLSAYHAGSARRRPALECDQDSTAPRAHDETDRQTEKRRFPGAAGARRHAAARPRETLGPCGSAHREHVRHGLREDDPRKVARAQRQVGRRKGDARELVDRVEGRRARLVLGPVLVLRVEDVDERERDAAHLDGPKEKDRLSARRATGTERKKCEEHGAIRAPSVRARDGRVARASGRARACGRDARDGARSSCRVAAAWRTRRRPCQSGERA